MRKARRYGTFLLLLVGLWCGSLKAATYYVAKTGSGTACTIGSPCLTVAVGLGKLVAGDTLVIHAGSYSETIGFFGTNIPAGISDLQRTVIQAATGETVTLNEVDIYSRSYITIQGITFNGNVCRIGRNATTDAAATFVTFDTVTVQNWVGGGSGAGAIMPGFRQEGISSNLLIKNCSSHNNGSTSLDHGLYISTQDVTVDGGTFYSNAGHGIQVYTSGQATATNNTVIKNTITHDNGSYGIGLYSGDNLRAYNNIVYHNGIIVGSTGGLRVSASSGSPATNPLIFNNTVYNNTGYGIRLEVGASNVNIRNNISYNNSGVEISDATGGSLAASNVANRNNLCDTLIATLCDGGNPLFVNAAANNFQLQTTSPAINAGTSLSTVTTDFAGVSRPQGSAYDEGAYEYVPAIPPATGWTQLTNTSIRPLCPAGINGNCDKVTLAWASGAFDTLRNRLLIMGGGHTDYEGNEIYSLDVTQLTMTRITNPGTPGASDAQYNGIDPFTNKPNCPTSLVGGTQPNSNHTYDSMVYMPNVDRMWYKQQSNAVCGIGSAEGWQFNMATNAWEHKSSLLIPSNTGPGLMGSYDPTSGKVFYHGNFDLLSYNPLTDTYVKLTNNGTGFSRTDWMTSVIDPTRHRFYLMGGGQGALYYDLTAPYARHNINQTGGTAITQSGQSGGPGLAYDSAIDRIVGWAGGDTVYLYDANTDSWTSQTFTGGPGASNINGTYKRWAYSPASDVFVVVNSVDNNAYSLRLSPPVADTVAPSVPTNLGANTVSNVEIDLAWTASTDNVGVAGYQIYRNGSQVALSPTNSYQDTGLTASTTYTYTVAAYDSSSNVSAQSTSASATTGAVVNPSSSNFQISSTASGTLPFTVGLIFKKGDIPNFPILDIAEYQVVVKRRWNDGSVKHAIASGQTALTANVLKTITVSNSTAAPTGTALTSADITAANPVATVQLGSIGTANLSSLFATPFRTWLAGPEMVECHYRTTIGGSPGLNVWFYVRFYKAGRIWIRAIVENGYLNVSTDNGTTIPNITQTYLPLVNIGANGVYNNNGLPLTHYGFTRWSAEGWVSGGFPDVIPKHNSQYLMDTKLVPNYWKRSPSATVLNSLLQTYTQMSNGSMNANMGDTGFQSMIGLLPTWDALYVTSTDSRAYYAVLANSSSLNSYPIVWRDSSTQLPATPANWPSYGIDGGTFGKCAGSNCWEMNHAPSEGYLAYLLTGDYWHYETMEFNAALNYLALNTSHGVGLNKLLTSQTRGTGWNLRTLVQFDAVCPSGDAVCFDYQTLLANNMTQWLAVSATLPSPSLGDIYEYDDPYGGGKVAPWQQHFWIQSVGMGSDLEPLVNMSTYNQVRDFQYKWPIGILGDSSNFYFTYASLFNLKVTPASSGLVLTGFYPTWAQAWAGNITAGLIVSPTFNNTLQGTSGSDPLNASTGYWGNLIPAIAYAVDHGATGASAAWLRLTGATNWSAVGGSGFDDIPTWGIVPRTVIQAPPPTPPAPPTGLIKIN
jgi:parallel beta-helix repeat protein